MTKFRLSSIVGALPEKDKAIGEWTDGWNVGVNQCASREIEVDKDSIKEALIKGRRKYYDMYPYDRRPNRFLIELQVEAIAKSMPKILKGVK